MDPNSVPLMTKQDEQKLRDLAAAIVRGIEEPETVLTRLGLTSSDYIDLSETRMFRLMLRTAQDEWEGASNTHKRIKLKAAVNIEEALPHFFKAMTSEKEPLSSKVKAFEVVSRVAGLGQTEQVASGAGQFFKLEINLGGNIPPMVLGAGVESMTIEHEMQEMRVHPLGVELASPLGGGLTQSSLFSSLPLEDL
jgi:hypothetical protein